MKATELIKPEEIRVGNWIKNKQDDVFGKIEEIHGSEVYINDWSYGTHPLSECAPIELTEELLLRVGYECMEYLVADLQEKCLFPIEIYTDIQVRYFEQLKLHELQNIWKALTGKELTLN